MLDERPLLAFQKNARFQAFHSVPRVLGDIDTVVSFFLTDDATLYHLSIVIVDAHPDLAFQDDEGLVLGRMMMHRNQRAWFQSIKETMAFVIEALVKVVVHSQPRRTLCLVSHFLYQLLVYDFHIYNELKVVFLCTSIGRTLIMQN